MVIAAAEELAKVAEELGLSNDRILPSMEDWTLYPRVAASIAVKAVEEGHARRSLSYNEELERASEIISNARRKVEKLVEAGLIRVLEGD